MLIFDYFSFYPLHLKRFSLDNINTKFSKTKKILPANLLLRIILNRDNKRLQRKGRKF